MTEAPLDTSPEALLQALLRRAEMQNLQLELEVRFKRNMALFKEAAPEIYEEYIHYEPKELRLEYTPEGYLNLVNYQLNNKPVYAENPAIFCEKQADDFLHQPIYSSVSFAKSKIMNDSHIHVPLINEFIDISNTANTTTKVHSKNPAGLMIMTGCGLGYQIPHLLKNMDIYTLVIFDPHKDSFYASLHTLDWCEIISYFLKPGKMIKLLIGMETADAMADLKLLTDKIGLYNIVYTFLYRHFESTKAEEFIARYKKEFHLNASGTGFFDDEQVSFAHTAANLNNQVYLFRQHPLKDTLLPPLLLIGNGPSLDKHISFIQENLNNAVVMSCGTALSSLAKKAIKPDFHVEMERNIDVKDWLEIGTQPEDRQGVTLLCLNTCAPEVIALFDDACIARKPNDCGEKLIEDVAPASLIRTLPLCNPTVTNAGLSFALAMGFNTIYLIGVDLGMSPEGDHHSTLSPYHSLSQKTQLKNLSPLENTATNYFIKGNFCEQVSTSLFLDSTRVNMQILLRHYNRAKDNIQVYNSNNGAFIDGTLPTPLDKLPPLSPIQNKPAFLHDLKAEHFIKFSATHHTNKSITKKYLKGFFGLRKQITLPKRMESAQALYTKLNEIYRLIVKNKDTDPIACMLLRGSIHGYFSLFIRSCLYQTDPATFASAYEQGRQLYSQFLQQVYAFMEQTPLKLDDTHDKNIIAAKQILNGPQ